MTDFLSSTFLLLSLLNPFLVIIYLLDVIQKKNGKVFRQVLIRGGMIAGTVFCCFALVGEAIFTQVVQAEFGSFQIFGGVVFLLIGLQFVFQGPTAIQTLRGEAKHLAGAIAMPVLIGPGTISASIVIGKRLPPLHACAAVMIAVSLSIFTMLILKAIHDFVRSTREELVERYIEVAGRIAALYVGTVAIDMVMQGVKNWIGKF